MAVAKRQTTAGESKFYHYRFLVDGKNYNGVCKGCTTKATAEKFEKDLRQKIIELSTQKNVKALSKFPSKFITSIPAFFAATMPLRESSIAIASSGVTPAFSNASKYASGKGL